MRDQDSTLEQLFAATRSVERVRCSERERLHRTVAARLTAAGVLSLSTTMTAKAVASGLAASSQSSVLLGLTKGKLLTVAMAVGLVGVAGTWLTQSSRPPEVSAVDGAHAVSSAAPALPPPVAASSDTVAAMPLPAIPAADPGTRPSPSRGLPEQTAASSLADELAAVRTAQSSLAAGDSNRALKTLDSYFRRFPRGVLLPEARATQIRALCQAGLAEKANQQAAQFEAIHRDSPLAAGQRLRCSAPGKQ